MTNADSDREEGFERAHKLLASLPGWLSAQANAIEEMNKLPSRFEQLIVQGRNAQEAGCDTRLEGFDIQAKAYLELVSNRATLTAYLIFLGRIREGELKKVQRVVHRTPKPVGINEEFWEYKNANYPDDSERVNDPLGGEIVRFESGLMEKTQDWTAKAYWRAAASENCNNAANGNGAAHRQAGLANGGPTCSDSLVAVCPSIVAGQVQAPELFSSEEQACRWLSQGNPKRVPRPDGDVSGKNGEVAEIPAAQPATPKAGSRETDPIQLDNLVDVDSQNERWCPPIPVRHLADYDLKVPFEGSIANFLPLTITRLPGEPSLETPIYRFFKRESPEISCCLGEDWEFEKIALSPRVRLGRYNLVEQTGMIGMALRFVCDLETNLNLRIPELSSAAAADFWCSWQTNKYLADFCYELGHSKAAIALLKHPEIAESAAKKILGFLKTQVAAFAQSVAAENVNEPVAPILVDTASTRLDKAVALLESQLGFPGVQVEMRDGVDELWKDAQAGSGVLGGRIRADLLLRTYDVKASAFLKLAQTLTLKTHSSRFSNISRGRELGTCVETTPRSFDR